MLIKKQQIELKKRVSLKSSYKKIEDVGFSFFKCVCRLFGMRIFQRLSYVKVSLIKSLEVFCRRVRISDTYAFRKANIDKEIARGSYRGYRHKRQLPIRGRTHANGRTRKFFRVV